MPENDDRPKKKKTDVKPAPGAAKTPEKKKKPKPKDDVSKTLKSQIIQGEQTIKDLEAEVAKLKEEYLRQLADKENLRKRLDREKSEYYQYALSEVLMEFLVVLDNFERALQSDDLADSKNFREGVDMIFRQFKDVLLKQGVIPISISDETFDPRFHQALATEESEDVDETKVAEVFQRGYMFHDRLLRPALVKVIVPKKEKP